MSENNELDKQLLKLCRSGAKLAAIKLYMDRSGLGLKDSKDYVDQLTSDAEIFAATTGTLDEQILQLCARGNKLEAIKRYHDATKSGLRASKDYVEALWEKNSHNRETTTDGLPVQEDKSAGPGIFKRLFNFLTGDKA